MEFVEPEELVDDLSAKRGGTGGATKNEYRACKFPSQEHCAELLAKGKKIPHIKLRLWIPADAVTGKTTRWCKAQRDAKNPEALYVKMSDAKFAGAYQRRSGDTRDLNKCGSPVDVEVTPEVLARFTDEYEDVALVGLTKHTDVYAVRTAAKPAKPAKVAEVSV